MATKLRGFLALSRIPKELVVENKKGEKGIWVDIYKKKEVGKFGDTHTITIYTKEKGTIYLCDLKPEEFGKKEEKKDEKKDVNDDLPF